MPMICRLNIAALPLLFSAALLAGCGEEPAEMQGKAGEVSGEVLKGTISDAMLPLDTVSSQPPLAEPDKKTGDSAGGGEAEHPAAQPAAQAETVPETPAPAALAPKPPADPVGALISGE